MRLNIPTIFVSGGPMEAGEVIHKGHERKIDLIDAINCLTEALGLALPGNGTILATHADRRELFLEAGRRIVEITRRHYETDDFTVLPRNVATFTAFENAMTLDISMGGSTSL